MLGGPLRALALALLVVVAVFLQTTYEIRTIPDDATAMDPAVRRHTVRVFRTDGALPPRGAVVWFEHPSQPGKMLISRVAGAPGDRVALRSGRLVRGGRPVADDHVEKRIEGEELAEVAVPEGHVYLLNDVRGEAGSPGSDSRRLGPVPAASVVGWLGDRLTDREEREGGREPAGRKGAGAAR